MENTHIGDPLPSQAVVTLDAKQEQQLHMLCDAFLTTNATINLSAHRTRDACWNGNILDSLGGGSIIKAISRCASALPHPRPFPHGGKGEPMEKYIKQKTPKSVLRHAREMRKHPTDAEHTLWQHLRLHQLEKHFRRQHPIDHYIMDFYCHELRLGIEIDGDIHDQRTEYDSERTENIEHGHGMKILRFSNEEVLCNTEGVVQRIQRYIDTSPPPVGEGLGVGEMGGCTVYKDDGKHAHANAPLPPPSSSLPLRRDGGNLQLLDLGTGGGFPLLPLAIAFPDMQCTGVDSVRKKMDAVQRIAEQCNIGNVTLIAARAEDLGRKREHRESYDIVTARAVAETRILLEYCAPFVRIGGKILLWKSTEIDDELASARNAASVLGLQRMPSHLYDLQGNWGKRQIVIYEKIAETPQEYPRPVGIAKKKPL